MEILQAQRGKGIDGLVQKYTPVIPEVQKSLQVSGTAELFPTLFSKYVEAMLEMQDKPYVSAGDVSRMQHVFSDSSEMYQPDLINSFLQVTRSFSGFPHCSLSTGIIISTLIQQSYLAGNNNFELETTNLPVAPVIAYELWGKKGNPIRLAVLGDTGESVGFKAQDVDITISGSARNLAQYSHRVIIDVVGNVKGLIGYNAFDSTFKLHGKVQKSNHLLSAHNCVVQSNNRNTLKMIRKSNSIDHRLVFIHPDGREELI